MSRPCRIIIILIYLHVCILSCACEITPLYKARNGEGEQFNYNIGKIKCSTRSENCTIVLNELKKYLLTVGPANNSDYYLDIDISHKVSPQIYEDKDDITRYLVKFEILFVLKHADALGKISVVMEKRKYFNASFNNNLSPFAKKIAFHTTIENNIAEIIESLMLEINALKMFHVEHIK